MARNIYKNLEQRSHAMFMTFLWYPTEILERYDLDTTSQRPIQVVLPGALAMRLQGEEVLGQE
jgi:hypothetical protein